jgi:hypothetical protein
MKTIGLTSVFVILLFAIPVAAQQEAGDSAPPTVVVLKKSWSKGYPPMRDSFRSQTDVMQQVRAEKAVIERRQDALPNQPTEERMPVFIRTPAAAASSGYVYIYKIKVKNTGDKTITKLYWEYQFLDPQTKEVLGSRRIYSTVKLAPGKIRTIEADSRRQPTIRVTADNADKKYQDSFTERVIIHRIHYADGSAWERPPD